MTTYLTKNENGITHHFRATVEQNGVAIVSGEFYNYLAKYWQGCGDNASAQTKLKELVDEKLKEGFQIAEYRETLENSVDVYDKAKWHFGGNFPEELDIFQGYVHTGMFLGWLIDNDLISDQFKEDFEEEISDFKNHERTGSQIFEGCCDGVLTLEELNETGNRFALPYFNFDTGQYLSDYETTLASNLPSTYHVADNWENYEKLKKVLDRRFAEWKSQSN